SSIVVQTIIKPKTTIMKIVHILTAVLLSASVFQLNAQTEASGVKKATIVLADGSSLTGLAKDNIRKNASVVFAANEGDKKKTYHGSELNGAEIEGVKFICIKGDFFKVHCEGDLSFLQKASDASGKVVYNGNEAVVSSGTDGKLNDYFIYNSKDKQLTLVSKKNVDEVVSTNFAGCAVAINKAKEINGDLSQLRSAVELYNNRNK
ncbi:MAG TPA: hypothetical protein VF476_17595, partial [Chitinophagaceae bacterium]